MGFDFASSFGVEVGDGRDTKFWSDKWLGSEVLGRSFNRLLNLESNKEAMVYERGSWEGDTWVWKWAWRREPRGREVGELERLSEFLRGWSPKVNSRDQSKWLLGEDGVYSVQEFKRLIADSMVERGEQNMETSWSKLIPKKINIFLWRARLGRLPSRTVLDRMGLDISSILCPRCGKERESIDHALVSCEEVYKLWKGIARWWKIAEDRFETLNDVIGSNNRPSLWGEMVGCVLYLIWSHRNRLVFKGEKSRLVDLFFEFQRKCYVWLEWRSGRRHFEWNRWLANPEGLTAEGSKQFH